jgi:hypothetical protein
MIWQYLIQKSQSKLVTMSKIFSWMGEEDTKELLRLLEKLYSIVIDYNRN